MASKITHLTVGILSILFALVQYNDPDAFLWMVIYLFVAYLAFRGWQGKVSRQSLFFISFVFILWGINQFPPEWEGVLFNEVGMKTLNIELGRESFGLFINAVSCGLMGAFGAKS
ncbi:Transmembrane family 220, helix [Spirosomataceae bacterium TFI 002]|nr:Transmembrane family 220, helix [Spirosomataceae bacterium TFI 002]